MNRPLTPLYCLLPLLALSLLTSCGGGTRGTGLGGTNVRGSVQTASTGEAVPQAMVTVETTNTESGEIVDSASTSTDDNGDFSVELDTVGDTVSIKVSRPEGDGEVALQQIPLDTESIDVDLSVSDANEVEAERVDVRRRPRKESESDTTSEESEQTPVEEAPSSEAEAPLPPEDDIDETGPVPPLNETPESEDEETPEQENAPENSGRRIRLTCEVRPQIESFIETLLERAERPIRRQDIRIRTEVAVAEIRCGALMDASRVPRCQSALRRQNEATLEELSPAERRVSCRARVEVTLRSRRPEQPDFRRVGTVKGVWNRKDDAAASSGTL